MNQACAPSLNGSVSVLCVYPLFFLHVCSAGVGRSGTFIAVDAMMERLKEKDDINIYEFLYSMRCDRPFMIQNVVSELLISVQLEL